MLGLARLDADRLEPDARGSCSSASSSSSPTPTSATPSDDWSWFEDELSYDNARLSQALISGGSALGRDDLVELGLESLRWLGDECGLDGRLLRLPGHDGRRRGEAAPGAGDEQPLDAAALVEAELAAFAITREAEHGVRARARVRVVPRTQPPAPAALRLRDRRLQRRARQRGAEPQRGRRVDARVPPRRAPARRRRRPRAVRTASRPTAAA